MYDSVNGYPVIGSIELPDAVTRIILLDRGEQTYKRYVIAENVIREDTWYSTEYVPHIKQALQAMTERALLYY